MKSPFYIFINGILTKPSDADGWISRAESWVEEKTKFKATTLPYFADIIFRRWFQGERVDNLCKKVNRVLDNRVVLVGHSNGCDIIERFIKRAYCRVDSIHLIAAASEKDFKKNGYNVALRSNRVRQIFIYHSLEDSALRKAKWSTRIFGRFGFGYGYLGLVGPENVDDDLKDRVHSIPLRMDHSEYFNEKNFDNLMRVIVSENVLAHSLKK